MLIYVGNENKNGSFVTYLDELTEPISQKTLYFNRETVTSGTLNCLTQTKPCQLIL